MSVPQPEESPRKRVKLSPEIQQPVKPEPAAPSPKESTSILSSDLANPVGKEAEVGITEYVSAETPGFQGLLKKRYTDFLVNEILPDGRVLHLERLSSTSTGRRTDRPPRTSSPTLNESVAQVPTDIEASSSIIQPTTATVPLDGLEKDEQESQNKRSKQGNSPVSVEDITKLISYLNDEAAENLLTLYNKILASPNARPRNHGAVTATVPTEKSTRTALHQDIRRMFGSKIESSTDMENNAITFSAAMTRNKGPSNQRAYDGNQNRRQGKLSWAERGGDYLHFSLYKENKDTMEVISFLTRQMRVNVKNFQFAGTKDRRAVTVQRVSAFRVEDGNMAQQNRSLRSSAVGDFEYQKYGLELGDLKGNEFIITLRECQWEHAKDLPSEEKIPAIEKGVSQACRDLHDKGFFNYYGLQRFGTFSTRTDIVGRKLLQGDFEGACSAIMHYSPHVLATAQDPHSTAMIGSDDKARAEAIHLFDESKEVSKSLDKLPRKFSAESSIIRHLGRNPTDYAGAMQTIPRNLKLMYVHAYQSLVWNFAIRERWRLFGNKVVEGDLVLLKEHQEKGQDAVDLAEEVDVDGEAVVRPEGEDRAPAADDRFERARPLSAEEATSGQYSIFDVVLPLPGFDVVYPANAMTEFYQTFMGSERGGGLDPYDMRRKQRDFSLSGSYRKMLARIEPGYEVEVRAYGDDNEQFVETDLDRINKNKRRPFANDALASAGQEGEAGDKLAVILKMQLGSSQYATMALRELSKSGIQAYKPDFGGGR